MNSSRTPARRALERARRLAPAHRTAPALTLAAGNAEGPASSVPRGLTIVHWILRIAVAAEFVGHGAFGILTKAAWVPYFGLVGIPEWLAWPLMPVVGAVDIALGILALVRPMPAALLYMAAWGFWTALLRPLTGEGWWEFLERAGNVGVPLAFFYWSQPGPRLRDWFAAVQVRSATPARAVRLAWILRITTAALLIGHGGFGAFMVKATWVGYLGAAGIAPQMVEAASLITRLGWFEIALGLLVLARPAPGVLGFVFAWKVGTELLRPMVGEPFWEFIERGGSYAAPLALLYVRRWAHLAGAAPETDNVDEQPHAAASATSSPAPAPSPALAQAALAVDAIRVNGHVPDGNDGWKDGRNDIAIVVAR